jgi:hypothetical protein
VIFDLLFYEHVKCLAVQLLLLVQQPSPIYARTSTRARVCVYVLICSHTLPISLPPHSTQPAGRQVDTQSTLCAYVRTYIVCVLVCAGVCAGVCVCTHYV